MTVRPLMVHAVAALLGCTGSIGGPGAGSDDPDNGLLPNNPQDLPPDDAIAPPGMEPEMVDSMNEAMAKMCTPSIPPAPLRRLSWTEYQTTIQDLFKSTLSLTAPMLLRDPSEHGFENRAKLLNPSPLLVEQYGTAAEGIGVKVSGKIAAVTPCTPATAAEEKACGERLVAEFGAKVFRRPLTTEERTAYLMFFEKERAVSDFKGAVQLTTEVFLQSPQFLYRFEFGDAATAEADRIKLTGQEIATRLSYLLTGGPPDKELWNAAAAGALDTADQRETQARRFLADARAGSMMVEFHRQWLDFDGIDREPKDAKAYPSYNDTLKKSIREESDRFVKKVLWQGDGKIGSFLSSPESQVDGPLAGLYGVTAPSSGWGDVTLNPNERAGWLTRANFLASRAHQLEGSPPLRSVFILERMFCVLPPAPPADANLSEPKQSARTEPKTNRELFEERIAPTTCNGCHGQIDTIGYGLENYNAIGGYRTMDNGQPVNAQGEIKQTDVDGAFTGGVELSQKLAGSKQLRTCVATNWLEFGIGRGIEAVDECRLAKLNLALGDASGDIRELLVALAKSPEFIYRPPVVTQ